MFKTSFSLHRILQAFPPAYFLIKTFLLVSDLGNIASGFKGSQFGASAMFAGGDAKGRRCLFLSGANAVGGHGITAGSPSGHRASRQWQVPSDTGGGGQ